MHAAYAQQQDGLAQFMGPDAPQCIPLGTIAKVAKTAELTPDQFQFVRAVFIAAPPVSHELPPGDRGVLATDGNVVVAALVSDGSACARIELSDFMVKMLIEVGEGQTGEAPGIDN